MTTGSNEMPKELLRLPHVPVTHLRFPDPRDNDEQRKIGQIPALCALCEHDSSAPRVGFPVLVKERQSDLAHINDHVFPMLLAAYSTVRSSNVQYLELVIPPSPRLGEVFVFA